MEVENIAPRKKITIKNIDMTKEMKDEAIECAATAIDKYEIEKDIADFIRDEFEKRHEPTWHCIVGREFTSCVTHDTKYCIFFYIG